MYHYKPFDPVKYHKPLGRFNLLQLENKHLKEENRRLSIKVVHLSNIQQKFAAMDRKIVWYGSVNLLSFGSAQESLMRIESANIARELEKTVLPE